MLLLALSAIAFAFGVFVARVCALAHLKWRVLRRIPHLASSDTIKGSVEVLADNDKVSHALHAASEQLGTGIFSFRVFHISMVVITDAALVQQALPLPKDPAIYDIFNMLTTPGGRQPNLLGHLTHDGYWKLIRKGVAPAFAPRAIRAEFPHLLAVVDRLSAAFTSIGAERFVDVDNALQRESMEVIGRVGFGHDFGAIESFASGARDGAASAAGKIAADAFNSLREGAHEITLLWNSPFRVSLRKVLPSARRGAASMAAVQAHMRNLLEVVRARGPLADDDLSIAAHLLRIRDPATGKGLTDEQLAGEIGLFLFAGFETTGHTMAWALYLLARHPQVQAKLEAELDAAGLLVTATRPAPRALEFKDLSQLRYLGVVIKESMRLVPVVAGGTMRASPMPICLGGYEIPARTPVLLQFYGLHNSTRNWDRPEEFDPGRWADPNAEYWTGEAGGAAPKMAASEGGPESVFQAVDQEGPGQRPRRYLPFSGGPRSCIGQNLASMNYTATLAVLISRFTFVLPKELNSDAAQWDLQHNRITNQPLCKDGRGLPMRCISRAGPA